jgi:hypothetical protein
MLTNRLDDYMHVRMRFVSMKDQRVAISGPELIPS